jgi:hypothetical protein
VTRSTKLYFASSLLASALLSGCGAFQASLISSLGSPSGPSTPATPSTAPGSAIVGTVHGGQDPVVGAHIYLLAANPGGYGASSLSLLNSSQPGVETDSKGSYVLTNTNGNFSISGDYTCTTGQQVYILASGGNPGGLPVGEINPALALMAAFGACPEGQTNFASTVPYVSINEVSTVAAAYALSGFMSDPFHLSSTNTPGALQGVANAFRTVTNLVDLATGTARLQNVKGNGDVPQAEINTLANLLISCVNSDGTSGCAPLLSNAPALDGTAPTDTITAALNIAHNPAVNVAALYNGSLPNPVFQPVLSAAPSDWTLSVTYNADNMVAPYFPAIDSVGNVWVPGYIGNNLTEFDTTGAILSGSSGFTGGLNLPYSIAIDAQDNPWVVNFGPINASSVSKFSTTGAALSASPFACASACYFPAFDAAQNLWISGTDKTTVLRADGSVLKNFTTAGGDSGIAINSTGIAWTIGQPRSLYRLGLSATLPNTSESTTAASGADLTSVAIDSADNVWYASNKNNAIGVSDKNGVLVSPANGYTGGGLKGPAQIAIDGSNRVWVANRDGSTLSAFTNTGVPISPSTGYQSSGLSNPRGLAIDASGNVWLTNFTYNTITEFIGIATPSATPISPANHGQRP